MLNNVDLMGRLVVNPEYREYEKEDGTRTAVARYRLAVDSDNNSGTPAFIFIKVFGKSAAYAHDNFHKGDLVVISGRLVTESYDKEDGEKVYTTLVYANRTYLARRKAAEQSADPQKELKPGKDRTGGAEPPAVPEPEEYASYMPELPDDLLP